MEKGSQDIAPIHFVVQSPSAGRKVATTIQIVAVKDEEYYGGQNRSAGIMHHLDEAKLQIPNSGLNVYAFGDPMA